MFMESRPTTLIHLHTCIPFVQERIKKNGTCMILILAKYIGSFDTV